MKTLPIEVILDWYKNIHPEEIVPGTLFVSYDAQTSILVLSDVDDIEITEYDIGYGLIDFELSFLGLGETGEVGRRYVRGRENEEESQVRWSGFYPAIIPKIKNNHCRSQHSSNSHKGDW